MRVNAVFDRIIGFLAAAAIILIVFAMLSICADVVLRRLFAYPLKWVIEIAEYILLVATFLGAAWVLKREGHVKIDIVLSQLGSKNQALLNSITSIIGMIVCLALVWLSVQTTWNNFQIGYYYDTPLRWPAAPFHAVVAVGSFLLFIQFLRRTHGHLGSYRHYQTRAKS